MVHQLMMIVVAGLLDCLVVAVGDNLGGGGAWNGLSCVGVDGFRFIVVDRFRFVGVDGFRLVGVDRFSMLLFIVVDGLD